VSSQRTLSCSLAELPSQIVVSVPQLGKNLLRICSCGCNRLVSRWTECPRPPSVASLIFRRTACCINSCICYPDPYSDLDECPKCMTLHLNESGRATRMFSYMSLIRRLRRIAEHAKTHRPGTITDNFDGHHYRSLLGEPVVVGDRTYAHIGPSECVSSTTRTQPLGRSL